MGWVYFGITSGLVETKHKKESGEEKTGRQRGNEGECGVYCGFLFFLFRFLFSLFSCLIDFDYYRVWERFDVAGEVFVLSRTWMGYCLRWFYLINSIFLLFYCFTSFILQNKFGAKGRSCLCFSFNVERKACVYSLLYYFQIRDCFLSAWFYFVRDFPFYYIFHLVVLSMVAPNIRIS